MYTKEYNIRNSIKAQKEINEDVTGWWIKKSKRHKVEWYTLNFNVKIKVYVQDINTYACDWRVDGY